MSHVRMTDALVLRLRDEEAEIQKMFTPERLAHTDKALEEVDSGKFFTSEQVEEHFQQKEKA